MTLITDANDPRLAIYEKDGIEYGLAHEEVLESLRAALRAQLAQANTQLDAAGKEEERLRGVCMELRAENERLELDNEILMDERNALSDEMIKKCGENTALREMRDAWHTRAVAHHGNADALRASLAAERQGTHPCPVCDSAMVWSAKLDGWRCVECELRAMEEAKEEAERKVCGMKEAFELRLKEGYSYLDTIFALEKALSSSAPCRHKAEADALREEVKGLKDLALIRCPVCGSESAGSNEMAINKELYALRKAVEWIAATLMDEKHWGEVSNADLVAELRRIAEGGRG